MTQRNESAADAAYYVSPDGNDLNNGAIQTPFKTIARALKAIRHDKSKLLGGVTVFLADGFYSLAKAISITPSDNLSEDGWITFRAITGAHPIISGGIQAQHWEKTILNGISMYRTKVEQLSSVRRFFINGTPRKLASLFEPCEERKFWGWIPHTQMGSLEVRFGDIGTIVNPKQLEAVWHAEWKTFIYRVDSITSPNILNMRQPYFNRITSIIRQGQQIDLDPNGYWWPNPARHPLYLQNDLSFLTHRGQFCFDELEKYLYYYPLEGETPETWDAVIPALDELLSIKGKGKNGTIPVMVKNVAFEGITFGYAAFSQIAREGMGINQAQCIYANTAKLRGESLQIPYKQMEGNININYAENIRFHDCVFKNTTGAGLYLHNGVRNAQVIGCVFWRTGDSGLVIGDGTTGYYDEENMTGNIKVENNIFRLLGQINHSAPALQAYFVRNLSVLHNDIYDSPYSGIAVGWGWHVCMDSVYSQNNVIEYNKIGNFNNQVRDGGGIYTLGQQPDSFCRYNYIYEQKEAFGSLYHDEGSAYYTTTDNVIDTNTRLCDTEQRWLNLNGFPGKGPEGRRSVYDMVVDHNYTSNPRIYNGGDSSSVTVSNTIHVENGAWPSRASEIIRDAGLEPAYHYLFDKLIPENRI